MKLYNVEYQNNGLSGVAVVAAEKASNIQIILRQQGKLNATRYEIICIKEIGNSESKVESIVSDKTSQIKEVHIPITNTVKVPVIETETVQVPSKLDINSLTEKDIRKLKLRIDRYSRTLYVDRIGNAFKKKADDGHTVFCTRIDWNNKDYKSLMAPGLVPAINQLYQKVKGKYILCRIPFYIKCVESPRQRIYIHSDNSDTASIVKKESLLPKRYGMFFLKGKEHSRKTPENKKMLSRWVYIEDVSDEANFSSRSSLMKWAHKFCNDDKNEKRTRLGHFKLGKNRIYNHVFALGEVKVPTRKSYVTITTVDNNGKTKHKRDIQYVYHLKGSPIQTVRVRLAKKIQSI